MNSEGIQPYMYTCIHSPLSSRLPHNIEQSLSCYTAGLCWLCILKTAVCTCPFPNSPTFNFSTLRFTGKLQRQYRFPICPLPHVPPWFSCIINISQCPHMYATMNKPTVTHFSLAAVLCSDFLSFY